MGNQTDVILVLSGDRLSRKRSQMGSIEQKINLTNLLQNNLQTLADEISTIIESNEENEQIEDFDSNEIIQLKGAIQELIEYENRKEPNQEAIVIKFISLLSIIKISTKTCRVSVNPSTI